MAASSSCEATAPPRLAPRRLHEVCGPAAGAFAAVQAGLRAGPLLWILPPGGGEGGERPDPYGLAPFLDPGRLILVETPREEEVYWAMEESLRAGAAPFVIAEAPARGPLSAADLTRSRRLQLAAEAGGATGLLLIGQPAAAHSNAAETRWRATPAPAWSAPALSLGAPPAGPESAAAPIRDQPVWDWRLLKNKRGALGCWRVRWRGDALRLRKDGALHDPRLEDATDPLALAAPGGGRTRAAA